MSQESQSIPPPIMWAQRPTHVYVTICLEDCKDPTIEITPEKLYFKGIGGTERKMHELTINFYAPIDPDKTKRNPQDRLYELILYKEKEGPYWPRLTKEEKKFHWLKCDFNKWRDEDDSDEDSEGNQKDLESVMQDLSCLRRGGDTKPDFDIDDGGDDAGLPDSDDEEMPDLE